MLRNLLSPIRARFEPTSSPRSNTQLLPASPRSPRSLGSLSGPGLGHIEGSLGGEDDGLEDFARDVMVELMRSAVETLKTADEVGMKTEALAEIRRILVQDPRTKDVFRELDGFLVLMSVLSTVQEQPLTASSSPLVIVSDGEKYTKGEEQEELVVVEVVESARLVFVILSEAMYKHPLNAEWFRTHVGYEFLSHATLSLVSDPQTTTETLGLLLSLALHDFSVSPFFTRIRSHFRRSSQQPPEQDADPVIATIHDYDSCLQDVTIYLPGVFLILWNAIASLSTDDAFYMRCAMFKVMEMLSHVSHRNHAVLCGLGLLGPVFRRFCEGVDGSSEKSRRKEKGERERHLLQRLLRRLLEMGAETGEVRRVFERTLSLDGGRDEGGLDMELLDLLKAGMRSRWMDHFSLEGGSSLMFREETMRGLPSAGFTFMMWIRTSDLPKASPFTLFSIKSEFNPLLELKLNEDGTLSLLTSANAPPVQLTKSKIVKSRWTHVTLVHYPHRSSSPTIRLFVDGTLCDTFQSAYAKPELITGPAQYILGDDSESAQLSWCISSAYLLSTPLADELPKFVYYLGPRYSGTFQDPALIKFLTYESSTALNMSLINLATSAKLKPDNSQSSLKSKTGTEGSLAKALKDGVGVQESMFVFALSARYDAVEREQAFGSIRTSARFGVGVGEGEASPAEGILQSARAMLPVKHRTRLSGGNTNDEQEDGEKGGVRFKARGDVVLVKAMCLDQVLWKIGGPAVALRLVHAANAPHELSRALSILLDGLKSSWENSEDMERLRGYDILACILRAKAQLINLTGFETIFEFLGINFRSPEHSTIVNIVAYRSVALDFELWSHAREEIQQAHLEHFTTILISSRHKKFNMRQRLAKLGLVKRILFVLQTEWYRGTVIPSIVNALYAACQADFSRDESIKPVVSYLAANLHGGVPHADSPQSTLARIDLKDTRGRAEQVLVAFMSLLAIPKYYAKFASVLPLTRICLLLLGENPTPVVSEQVLNLIGISIGLSSSFIRKFELVSGWSVLKAVIPRSWDRRVHQAAFGLLTGRLASGVRPGQNQVHSSNDENWCTHIVPTILASLQAGLVPVTERCQLIYNPEDDQHIWSPELTMEALVEELMNLHTTSSAFRQVFASQQTTQLFVKTYKTFVSSVASVPAVNNHLTVRLLEKLTHFGLALALDNVVAGAFKREILDSLESAERVINPSAEKPSIDRSLVADNRSVRQRIASVTLSMHVGERMVNKTMVRMAEWRHAVCESEKKRLKRNLQDLREYRRQVPRLQEWTLTLTSERGLWPHHQPQMWRLDETDGPHRIRKKMEPANDLAQTTRVDVNEATTRGIQTPETESKTPEHAAEVPPWAESYEIAATDIEEHQLSEDIVEDKHRRVRHELEPGDVVEAVQTVARITGVDSSPGLLMIGKTHIYMLDGLVENDGEVIDAHDAPRQLFFVPGSTVELDGPQRAQRWSHSQIAGFSDKRFLFRDVALEMYFKDSRSLLIVFLDQKRRSEIDYRLTTIIARHSPEQLLNLKSPLFGKMGQNVLSGLKNDELASATRKWQAREISNFTYLSILNQLSGRTTSDATQYPVFPWVLQDYTSQTLDLTSPSSYRDLTKPMGTLTPERREAAAMRYTNLQSVNEEPFHYGTHFSSSMIVCHFLIRLAPFTNMFKTLQGGDWDLPDRLFSDLARAYQSAAADIRGDVRELIPEFFTCPEFLENAANLDFGVSSSTGERIHDVKLPPWARSDPLLFVTLNRRALESPLVSENLPQWIDLIWGYKQRDPESFNVFHPLSYEGSIDLDSIQDGLQREATVGIIHNFGQTPRKLFTVPHPLRYNHGLSTLPIGTLHGIEEDPHLLNQASRCFKDLGPGIPVSDFVPDALGDKLIPCPPNTLYAPLRTQEHIEWSRGSSDLRLFVDNKIVQVVEDAFCTCAAFADHTNLVTGSSDYMVRMWKVVRGQYYQQARVHLTHIMRIHTREVTCVAASRTWSLVVSGSGDGSVALWDLNKGAYVRSIWHGEASEANVVRLVTISESMGHIASCSNSKLCLHTINARHIATLDLESSPVHTTITPPITAMAFHERDYSHLGVMATGSTDGSITLRTWTADGTAEREKAQWEFLTIRTMKVRAGKGALRPPTVTTLKFWGESIIHGEETGKSYTWNFPD
ncbi:hypothetical protein AX15_007913 [Amanita polypyramis BW_CC]|nr:hypothetical protein AX15_007913 [Amanita polypyramis BW_CC]